MVIQTAGEQKYYELIKERAKTLRTCMIMWISLLAVALIAATSNIILGAGIGAAGIFLAVWSIKEQRKLEGKTSHILEKAEFYNQLISPESVEINELSLLITKDYLLAYNKEIQIYLRSELKKVQIVETVLETQTYQSLRVTDQSGSQQEIAICEQNHSQKAALMLAYQTLNQVF